jgi:hypothetical protein
VSPIEVWLSERSFAIFAASAIAVALLTWAGV